MSFDLITFPSSTRGYWSDEVALAYLCYQDSYFFDCGSDGLEYLITTQDSVSGRWHYPLMTMAQNDMPDLLALLKKRGNLDIKSNDVAEVIYAYIDNFSIE